MGRRVALLLVLAGLAGPGPAFALRRLAVLTPTAPWSPACAETAQRQDERCTLLDAVAEEARAGALAATGAGEIAVMTRENTAQILAESGATCAEGECEVETARLIGADYVVSGSVVRFEGTWLLTLKLHDVQTARLLRTSARVEGTSVMEVVRAARAAAEAMVRGGLGLEGQPEPGAATPAAARPWEAGVRLSWAFPLGPKLDDGTGPTSLPVFGFAVARRAVPRLRVEATGELYGIADMGTIADRTLAGGGELRVKAWGAWLLLGAELALTREGGLAAAAAVGGGNVNVRLEANGGAGSDVVDRNTPVVAFRAELRASRALSGIELGIGAGAAGYYLASAPRAVTVPGGTEGAAVAPGLVLLPSITVLVRFPL